MTFPTTITPDNRELPLCCNILASILLFNRVPNFKTNRERDMIRQAERDRHLFGVLPTPTNNENGGSRHITKTTPFQPSGERQSIRVGARGECGFLTEGQWPELHPRWGIAVTIKV
jgi:hypothetical protein